MSNADPGYYKAWKARLYALAKYITSFHYNINPTGSITFSIPAGKTSFPIYLRRGPHFWQNGIRGTVTNTANVLETLQNIFLTQTNIGGYLIVQRISLAELFGGTEGQGDSYRSVPWQWIAGEQMNFVLENPNNLVADLSITLFGRNVYGTE